MAQKIVKFDEYCKQCEHEKKAENEDPCWDCLTIPVNEDSYRPTQFSPKSSDHSDK